MPDAPHKKKYAPLGEHLAALPPTTASLMLSFSDVEEIIGDTLPPSAREYRQWWENQDSGSHAPLWLAAGFKVDKVDFASEHVRFERIGPPKAVRAVTLQEIITGVNERAPRYAVGDLPEWRKKHKGKARLPTTLFPATLSTETYAFHIGGRTELQFNIGYEDIDGTRMLRHGVAFSLEASRSLPDISVLFPKIERFNEFVHTYPDALLAFQMWHWNNDTNTRSEFSPVHPIPGDLVREGRFLFIGDLQPADAVDVGLILKDFDRLLPLYEFVESSEPSPSLVPEAERGGFIWTPGNKARATQSTYQRTEKTVDRSLRHNTLQPALFDYLKGIHGKENTSGEQRTADGTLIDVAVRVNTGYVYYELKTYSSAQACIREAIGQLLEYAYWPGSENVIRLIVVGEAPLDKDARAYLERLQADFSLPVEYRQFDKKSRRLV